MSDFETELLEPADDDFGYDDFAALEQPDYYGNDLDTEAPEPVPFAPAEQHVTQEQWDEIRSFVQRRTHELAEELGLGPPPPEPVDEHGRTLEQAQAVGQALHEQLLAGLPPELKEQAAARADEIWAAASSQFGGNPELAVQVVIKAIEDVQVQAQDEASLATMVERAVQARGVDPAKLDFERLVADTATKFNELQPQNLGTLAAGLAVVDAVLKQDPRGDPDLVTPTERWSLAAELVRDFQQPAPAGTSHDYRKGGSVKDRFFGGDLTGAR